MDALTVTLLCYAAVSISALVINEIAHRYGDAQERRDHDLLVHTMSNYMDGLESSNNVLQARLAQVETENQGLLDANFQLQRQNEQLRRDLEADAELKEMFGAG